MARWAVLVAVVATIVGGGSLALGVLRPSSVRPLPMRSAALVADGRAARPAADAPGRCGTPGGRPCPAMPLPAHRAEPVADPIVAAFAVQWDPESRAALRAIGDHLDWVIVEGAFLGRGAPGELTVELDPGLRGDARAHGVAVHLMVTNFADGAFSGPLVDAMLRSPTRRQQAIAQLVQTVRDAQLAGITIDFEKLRPAQHDAVLAFLGELRAALAPLGATLSMALPMGEDARYPMARYADAVDYLIPMLYDEHAAKNEPGPVASADWFARTLDSALAVVPGRKLLAGLGQYGYHWRDDQAAGVTVNVTEAMALGQLAPGGPWYDAASRMPYAAWTDAAGRQHRLWYLDATTAWNEVRASHAAGMAGLALWRLGSEDPALWSVLGRRGLQGSPAALERLPASGISVLTGEGEVLSVDRREGEGRRAILLDSAGFVASERLVRPPGGYVVTRAGAAPKRVALTFDDGPDPDATPAVLDTLRQRHAAASFFVIGRQAQRYPELLRRMAAEGHEIGNHTWSHRDLGSLGTSAITFEVAATGRVIEAVTGRRPMLFRPPFIGDARPASEERLRPLVVASRLGYRVAGLEVDPRDWEQRDPAMIVARTLSALEHGRGHVILLHDAGGDRAPTIAALGPLIDSLRARGYEITTVAGLLGIAPAAAMPAVPAEDAPHRWLDLASLRVLAAAESLLRVAFLAALVLGALRLLAIGGLALWQRTRPRVARRAADARHTPRVSILVPAFNEARVIARTMTSLLAQDYPDFEVLVIDDGSTDDTLAVARAAGTDPRVRVLTQPNAGKAAALNRGLALAEGDVVVVVDADTLLAPMAVRHLVRPFADRRVGAVAGNAKVGNRVNLVTRWQAVEYVTSQNLDRRAFAMLNCITVVPGAIGAWRRDAVREVGGFSADTLAEDQDLTMTLLRRAHRIAHADRAIAWTEAPETLGALLSQRFRWSFGTLQCAWKHRGALLRRSGGTLGLVGLPNLWLFQLLFPLLAPAADLALVATLVRLAAEAPGIGLHAAWARAEPVLALYALFLAIDTATALIGLGLERGESLAQAALVPLQRVAYRQVLYLALLRAMRAAITGWAPGWGKLERTGRAQAGRVAAARVALAPVPTEAYTGPDRRAG